MCSPCVDDEYNLSESTTPGEEIDRLSHWYLLQLSQVSLLWHNIAMGTPKLWSKIVLDTSLWRAAALSSAKLLSLLDCSLQRSGNHPLTMEACVMEKDPHPHTVMMLLSQHAPRWQDVYFFSDLASPELLVNAKGRLGRLEKLNLSAEWTGVDIFQAAPRLTDVQFGGRVENVPAFPWAQIRTFKYAMDHTNSYRFLSLLGRCPNIIAFDVEISLLKHPTGAAIVPRVSSNVESLSFELGLCQIAQLAQSEIVGQIFEPLTLPSLRSLDLTPSDNGLPPVWHTEGFLALADRSSFHSHLTRLSISAIITDQELLRSLAVLPLLDELDIHDYTSNGENILITDTLLKGLIRTDTGTNLVPILEFLCITSLLRFSDTLYRDVLTSRLPVGADDYFVANVWWLPGRQREFSPKLLLEVSELPYDGEFRFDSGLSS
ncbi:hypothetical protein DFH06DRAFT_1068604 [Mycena polygramma]|nr:hypothetical protein DFH06DRAFT_1068604 [Mycena polygramma]